MRRCGIESPGKSQSMKKVHIQWNVDGKIKCREFACFVHFCSNQSLIVTHVLVHQHIRWVICEMWNLYVLELEIRAATNFTALNFALDGRLAGLFAFLLPYMPMAWDEQSKSIDTTLFYRRWCYTRIFISVFIVKRQGLALWGKEFAH